jgi:hypothetical protein
LSLEPGKKKDKNVKRNGRGWLSEPNVKRRVINRKKETHSYPESITFRGYNYVLYKVVSVRNEAAVLSHNLRAVGLKSCIKSYGNKFVVYVEGG